MRFATWHDGQAAQAGVVSGDTVHPFIGGETVLGVIRSGLAAALTTGARAVAESAPTPLDEVRLLPPLEPPSIRDFAAFEKHVEGALLSVSSQRVIPHEWYQRPAFYFANPQALVGANDDVEVPPGSTELDFELEVAAIVTGDARSVSPDQAREHIFGYTIMNDWSARDIQESEMRVGLGPAKSKDSATTLGPWIVTRDELEGYRDHDGFLMLTLNVLLNGVEIGRDLLANMSWTFEELVAQAALGTVVRSGDVIGSGTCGNGGSLAELWGFAGERIPPPLQPSDVVEMVVEGIGSIRNRVVTGVDPVSIPAARPARSRAEKAKGI